VNEEQHSCVTQQNETRCGWSFTKAFALVGGAVNEHLGTDNIPEW
jgi:hypothetical protein